jgi:hypothetical protein
LTFSFIRRKIIYGKQLNKGNTMTKINKYRNTTEPKIITKNGVQYKELDLGGSKILMRIKSEKEVIKDYKNFAKYNKSLK